MKYNDFKMTDYSLNVRSDSKFFNRENMSAVSKTVTYFNNYFINPGILARLESNDMIFDYSIPSDLVDRMTHMLNSYTMKNQIMDMGLIQVQAIN